MRNDTSTILKQFYILLTFVTKNWSKKKGDNE